jgi:hypothetical protein
MSGLVNFLAARVAEEEADVRSMAAEGVDNILWRVWAGALDARAYLQEEDGTEEDYERMQKNQFARARKALALGDPDRALREVAAKRRVMERHKPTGNDYPPEACDGCGSHMEWGDLEPDTPDINNCPELQDLAYIWNEHEDWNQEWCPHVEGRHEVAVTEVPPARGCYTNACNRCGQGDGWHYRDRSTT